MASRGQWIFVGALIIGLSGLLGAGLALTPDISRVAVGSRAPDFSAVQLETGDTVALEKYRGELILLNIWATWCGPCEAEMPSLQELHDEFRDDGLHIVAVSVDRVAGRDQVQRWIDDRELTFEVWHDRQGRIERLYQTTGVPETFLIDRQGRIVHKVIGAEDWAHEGQKARIRRLLGVDPSMTSGEGEDEPAEGAGRAG